MNLVIPMAGAGKRFSDAGFTKPKPFISVLNKPMIERVLEPLSTIPNYTPIYITRNCTPELYNILAKFGPGYYKDIQSITEGAACTVLLAKEYIDNEEPLLICDCDAIYDKLVIELLSNFIKSNPLIDACSVCFTDTSPKNSFVAINAEGYTKQTAEKQVISDLCCTGMHWFRHGRYFVQAAETMIRSNDRTNNEFYVTPVINYLLRMDCVHKPLLIPNQLYNQIGTPQDVLNYVNQIGIDRANI